MRILLAIDHSRHSEKAVQWVAERPWPADSVVRILSVVRLTAPPAAELWADAGGDLETVRKLRRESTKEIAANAAALLSARGLRAETLVIDGNPKRLIVEQAKQWPADLIIVAPHTGNALDRWIAGSTSRSVLKHAPCTVEVFRETRRSS
jgi:nucleotide-binding universal stress UspA family protein